MNRVHVLPIQPGALLALGLGLALAFPCLTVPCLTLPWPPLVLPGNACHT